MNHTVSCFKFKNNKRVLFSASAKGWVVCVDDDMSLSNELQYTISAVSVVQTSTLKTAEEFEFGSLHK
jgi:hypothetical protein